MEVKIQKLRPGAVTPRRGSADAAGYDLYACPQTDRASPSHRTRRQ